MKFAVILCVLVALCVAKVPCQSPFAATSDFRVFAINNVYGQHSDIQGPVAAGSLINLREYQIGVQWGPKTEYGILSGGPVSFYDGEVFGSILGSSVSDIDRVTIFADGTFVAVDCCADANCDACSAGPSPLNFAEVAEEYRNLSDLWGSWPTTVGASYVAPDGNIELTCTGDDINIFSNVTVIPGLNNQITIKCKQYQTVLINYAAGTNTLTGLGWRLSGGITENYVIHHFGRSHTELTLGSMHGTVFAPFATLHASGVFLGDVVVNNFGSDGNAAGGQINYAPFFGCVPTQTNTKYCCLYEHTGYLFSYTNAFCSSLPCNHVFFPSWDLVGQYNTPNCRSCCFEEAD